METRGFPNSTEWLNVKLMRHDFAPRDNRPPGHPPKSQILYVKGPGHDSAAESLYIRDMANQEREAGQRLATTLRTRRAELGWTQERLAEEADVTRQTVIRYESGNAWNPEPTALRSICLALGIDIRQILVDLGYATREELEMPPEPERLPNILESVLWIWRSHQLTDVERASMLKHVRAAMELWADSMGRELPEKSAGKPPSPKRPSPAKR